MMFPHLKRDKGSSFARSPSPFRNLLLDPGTRRGKRRSGVLLVREQQALDFRRREDALWHDLCEFLRELQDGVFVWEVCRHAQADLVLGVDVVQFLEERRDDGLGGEIEGDEHVDASGADERAVESLEVVRRHYQDAAFAGRRAVDCV